MPKLSLHQVEFFFLLALAFFLPALEAPKNISVVFYLLFWVVNRWRSGDWGGRWSGWDSLVVALIVSAYAAAFFSGLPGKNLSGGNDVLVYGLLLITLRRSSLTPSQLWTLLGVLVAGTLITLAYGYWGLLITQQRKTLGLNSVGHVNHSAVYMGVVFSLALAGASVSQLVWKTRWLLWLATGLLFISLLVTSARGAVIPAVAFMLLWGIFIAVRRSINVWKPALLATVLLAGGLWLQPGLVVKTASNIQTGQMGSYRPALARTALLAAREYPVFGVGLNNFIKIDAAMTKDWQDKHGRWFADDDLYFASHAHSLYFNTLAERGLVGFAALLAMLAAMVTALWRSMPGKSASPLSLTLWGGAVGATLMMILGGLFNTTLHHENAALTMLLFGIWMASRNAPQENASP